MSHISLTEEQQQILDQSKDLVEVRDLHGKVVAHAVDSVTATHIETARRNRASNQPCYSSGQVQHYMRLLAEAVEREGLDEEKVLALLARLKAEDLANGVHI